MKYYIELALNDHLKIKMYDLLSKCYMQLHLAFVEQKDEHNKVLFGVSFPEYHFDDNKQFGMLGTKLRIFSDSESELQALNLSNWLNRLLDYVHISSIREVPKSIKSYATYSRKQFKGEKRLEERFNQKVEHCSKLHHISLEEAQKRYEKRSPDPISLPFIQLESLTTKQSFRLFIERRLFDEPTAKNVFSTYGLSTESTVPEF